jgi:hypothetical protein
MALARTDLSGVILVRDKLLSDGGFILSQLLKLLLGLDSQHRVLFVILQHSSRHYMLALRKIGINAPALVASRRLAFVDLLQDEPGHAIDLRQAQEMIVSAMSERFITVTAATPRKPQLPVCLLFDDASVGSSWKLHETKSTSYSRRDYNG